MEKATDAMKGQGVWPEGQDQVATRSSPPPRPSMFPEPPKQDAVVGNLFDQHIRNQDPSKKKGGHFIIKAKPASPLITAAGTPEKQELQSTHPSSSALTGSTCAYWNFLSTEIFFQSKRESPKAETQQARNGRPYHFYYVEEAQGSQSEESDGK